MQQSGVVEIVAMPDLIALGEFESHLAIEVHGAPVQTVCKSLLEIPEVRFIARGIGSYDLIVNLRTPGSRGMGDTVIDRIRRVRGVDTVAVLTVHDVVKDSYVWTWLDE